MKQPNKTENAIPEISSPTNKKIGNTTYEINMFFLASGKENINDKIIRLIKNDLLESA